MTGHPLREELSAYLEGDLARPELARISVHVGRCQACSEELERLTALVEVARLPPPAWEGKADAWDTLATRLTARRRPKGPALGIVRSRHGIVALTVAAAALAALMIVPAKPEPEAGSAPRRTLELEATTVADAVDSVLSDATHLPAAARSAYRTADLQLVQGIAALRRELEVRPHDPLLLELLERAIRQQSALALEAAS